MKAREDDDMYNNTSGRTITGSGKNFAAHTPSRMRNLSASPIMMSAAAASKGTKSKRVTLKPTATVKVAVDPRAMPPPSPAQVEAERASTWHIPEHCSFVWRDSPLLKRYPQPMPDIDQGELAGGHRVPLSVDG